MSRQTVCANLSLLLSRATSSPLDMDDEQPGMLRALVPYLPSPQATPAACLAEAWIEARRDREALAAAYARLFLGPFEILAPPYASFYLEPDQQIMGQVSQEVAHAYASAGLEPGEGPREAPDHVALEWEFVYFLTHRHVTTGNTDWLDRRNTFVVTHMLQWLPLLAQGMKEATVHPFYDALAELLATGPDLFIDSSS
jgi:TorA maturation chaperone TorD